MKKYPAYKDSGIEWIGIVPTHWKVEKIGTMTESMTGFAFKSDQYSFDEGTKVVRGDNVTEGYLRWGDKTRKWRDISPNLEPYMIKENDILIGMDGSKVGKNYARVEKGELPLLLVQRVARLRSESELVARLLEHAISSYHFKYYVNQSKTDPAIPHITLKNIRDFKVAMPPEDELEQLVNYLDHKTAEIDTLIEKKKQLIVLYKEERTATINAAVTGKLPLSEIGFVGLKDEQDFNNPINQVNPKNPSADKRKMKDSGIDWIGEIPEHWEVKKLKLSHVTTSGGTPNTSTENYYNGNIPWLRTLDLNDSRVFNSELQITEEALNHSSARMVPKNSVLVAMYGGAGTIGKSALLKIEAAINQAICAILPCENSVPEYLHYFMLFYRPYWMIGAVGTRKDPNISQEAVRERKILFPPKREQKLIANYLNQKNEEFNRRITKTQKEITLLEEYKTALISEVVLGKVDVREEKLS